MVTVKRSTGATLRAILLLSAASMLGACGSLTHYNHEIDLGGQTTSGQAGTAVKPKAILMDAKQRTVFATPGKAVVNGVSVDVVRICAEPSPDALSAMAASTSGLLSSESKAALQAALTVSETASNIGLRTQSIQLMRDAMYRVCEGVASGNVSQSQFEMLQRHFQNSMVAILAIEQLTGAVRAGNAQLSTTANLGSAKEIAELTQQAAEAKAKVETTEATATEKKAKVTAAQAKVTAYLADKDGGETGLSDEQKEELAPLKKAVTDAQVDQATADALVTQAKEKMAIYQAGLNAIGGGNLAASGTATVTGGSGGNALSGDSATAIATAVTTIVSEQINSGFFREACATLFIAQIDGRAAPMQTVGLKSKCNELVDKEISGNLKAQQTYADAQTTIANAYAVGMTAYSDCLKSKTCATKAIAAPAPPAAVTPPRPPQPFK